MKLLILSDIHGNLNAFNAVLNNVDFGKTDAVVLLGDAIDYGMRSNQVIEGLKKLPVEIICNIHGNHENAVICDTYDRFSSERGKESARHTRDNLTESSKEYLKNVMTNSGKAEFYAGGKKCLAVHGSLEDEYWKSVDYAGDLSRYEGYDFVFSGHSHLPHFFEKYYRADNPATRNKKKTVFINPGSVGQPRNLNNFAQYAELDTETEEIKLLKVGYDIDGEQKYFDGTVDNFYKTRLKDGV